MQTDAVVMYKREIDREKRERQNRGHRRRLKIETAVSKDSLVLLSINVYLCSEAERASPTPPEGSRHILAPLNLRLVLILVAVPAAPRLLEPVQPLLLHCTPPDLHQKPATHTRS